MTYYTEAVLECDGNQGALFSIINKLLHHSSSSPFTAYDHMSELVLDVVKFFDDKITKIHKDPSSTDTSHSNDYVLNKLPTDNKLSSFEPVTAVEVLKIIKGSAIKSCALDPIPAKLLCNILPILAPVITVIVTLPINSCPFPQYIKEAMIMPILKKP